ncbi:MAG: transporter substrate-binding domain-containing protein, partial [Wenzhouxiangellaceae bacterium]
MFKIHTVVWLGLIGVTVVAAREPPARQVVVGGDASYPPFEWLDKNGAPKGFNVELIRLLTEPVGVEVEHRLGDWPDTIRGLE